MWAAFCRNLREWMSEWVLRLVTEGADMEYNTWRYLTWNTILDTTWHGIQYLNNCGVQWIFTKGIQFHIAMWIRKIYRNTVHELNPNSIYHFQTPFPSQLQPQVSQCNSHVCKTRRQGFSESSLLSVRSHWTPVVIHHITLYFTVTLASRHHGSETK